MSEPEIPPALSTEEWAEEWDGGLPRYAFDSDCPWIAARTLQHAAPDGGPLFTWEMVEAMRTAAGGYRSGDFNGFNDWNDVQADLLGVAAARLASLLPPRTEPEP